MTSEERQIRLDTAKKIAEFLDPIVHMTILKVHRDDILGTAQMDSFMQLRLDMGDYSTCPLEYLFGKVALDEALKGEETNTLFIRMCLMKTLLMLHEGA